MYMLQDNLNKAEFFKKFMKKIKEKDKQIPKL